MKNIFILLLFVIILISFQFNICKAQYDKTSIIAASGFLLGGTINGKWIDAEKIAEKITGNENYKICSLNSVIGEFKGKKVEWVDGPGYYPYIDLSGAREKFGIKNDSYDIHGYVGSFDKLIGISCDWDPLPSKPIALDVDNKIYRKIVSDLLKQNGLDISDPNILQILKLDIDNDGQDEIFITASNLTFPMKTMVEKGMYSAIVARKIIDGKARNFVLESFVQTKTIKASDPTADHTPYTYYVPFILDADGDGKMEVFVQGKYYEGDWFTVYKFINNEFKKVLYYGVGA